MTVYVDDMRRLATVGALTSRWSHLITDSPDIEELHSFAQSIGLRRAWFQGYTKRGGRWRPHYDVTDPKRRRAIAAGAVEITWRDTTDILRRAHEATTGNEVSHP